MKLFLCFCKKLNNNNKRSVDRCNEACRERGGGGGRRRASELKLSEASRGSTHICMPPHAIGCGLVSGELQLTSYR